MNKKQLRKKLALMLATLKKKRPYYCEVEYLESDGGQWFDTGFNINTSTDEVVFNFQLISTTKYQWIMGEHDNGARFGIGVGDGTNLRNVAYGATTYKVNDTEMYNSIHYFMANSNGVYLNGTQVHGFESFVSTNPIYMFALNLNGSVSSDRASGRIWKYTQKRNGRAIIDLIPVLDWNMTPCMYDKVTGRFFYNQGTGTFTYGREIHYVDYLEGTGTQYIDTGFKPNQNTKVEVIGKFKTTYPSCLYATRWSGSPTYDTYGSYAEPTGLYSYYGRYSDGLIVGVPDSEFNYKDSWLSLIQDKNTLNYTNLETNTNWIYSFATTTFQAASNLYLLHFYTGTSFATNGGYMKSCKIWDNGTPVRDYKPAIDENGIGFMFDKVSHKIYDNVGTGVFGYPARELEYIESSGTQYIYTGIDNWNNTLQFEMKCSIQQQPGSGNKSWFGCYNTWSGGTVMPGIGTYTNYRVMNNFNTGYQASSGTDIGIANGQVGIYKLDEDSLSWSVGSAIAFDRSREFTNNTPCILFGTYYSGGPKEFASFKMYYFKFWLNGGLVRDYIPVFQNGVAGLLDKANGVFYDNDGTGDFLVGKIVEPEYE